MESVSLFIIQFSADIKKGHDSMEVCAKKQEYWPSKLYVGVLDISFIYYHVHPQILRPFAAPAFAALVNQGRGPQGRNFERKLRNFECSGKCYLHAEPSQTRTRRISLHDCKKFYQINFKKSILTNQFYQINFINFLNNPPTSRSLRDIKMVPNGNCTLIDTH